MLGGGVGFSIRKEDVHELPRIKEGVSVTHRKKNDADFIVPDSREGWVKLLKKVLKAYFYTGRSFNYSTILVRSAGDIIKGFGGKASGPGILIEGIDNICNVIKEREGKKLRSIDVLDICNIIGSVVVAGNVRRSAEIAVGDPDDYLYLRAKRWDLGNIPNWRAMSNNTIYADSYDHISDVVWKGYDGSGEPYGFFNLPLAQKVGRLGERRKDRCEIINPCAEILLESYECCNLSEIYLNNIESKSELKECAKLLYKTQKAICALPFIHKKTEEIVHNNMRIGIGITGVCQSLDKIGWLDECYQYLHEFDEKWSAREGYPPSIRLTTIKPSGCASVDCTVRTTSGIKSFAEIAYENGITSEMFVEGSWHKPKTEILVYDENNDEQKITNIFINGISEVYEIEDEDGMKYKFTPEHKLKTLNGWKRVDELEEGDKIVSF